MTDRTRSRRHVFLVFTSLALALSVAVGAASCGGQVPTGYKAPSPADYSKMGWSEAFEALHKKMSTEYAFTQWKGIDWKSMHDKYAPLIKSAESAKDAKAYETALREYVFSIPDGHVGIRGGDPKLAEQATGGGYGFNIVTLDNGNVVASWVMAGGPAAAAGMSAGAQVFEWDGKPIGTAIKGTSIIWEGSAKATTTDVLLARERNMVRSPVGTGRTIVFRNQGDTAKKSATLTAVADNGESQLHFYPNTVIPPASNFDFSLTREQSIVSTRMLPGNIGYMRILAEIDLPEQAPGNHTPTLTQFRNGLADFSGKGAEGVILDIRNNNGGSDTMVAEMLGSLYDKQTFYEYQNYLNPQTGKFEIWVGLDTPDKKGELFVDYGQGLFSQPHKPLYTKPIVALINSSCISSGEGIAMGVLNLPGGKTVGYYGTNGSFGMAGDKALMPGELEVRFPFGQSLDEDKIVQIDSKDMKGGIAPESRVPLTLENVLKDAAGTDVELEYAVKVIKQMNE